MPNPTAYLSDDEWQHVKDRAEEEHDGSYSPVLRELVREDMAGDEESDEVAA